MRLTAALIVRDEEEQIARAIRSVAWADEIIVVDGGSTDGTRPAAAAAGARVIERPWEGFAAARRTALAEARGGWILFIDADEEATPELGAEIRALLGGAPDRVGYRIRRRGLFLGRWMRHGAWGRDRVLRLARRDRARVEERRVHETMEVDGPVGDLSGVLLHHSQPDLASVGRKFGRYVELAAADLADRRRSAGRRIGAWEVALRPCVGFIRDYVVRLGFLDGAEGLLLAAVGALSTMAKVHRARRLLSDAT